jgi:chromosome segregation ATPase
MPRTRAEDLQSKLDTDQTLADALQSRINALNTDFVNRDDPVQRAGIDRDRQKANSELDRVKKSLQDGKKALADLDEEARKAGVPAGWLR